ncbi:ARM repeat superfamily protein isoform X2 [Wolffia australiana]
MGEDEQKKVVEMMEEGEEDDEETPTHLPFAPSMEVSLPGVSTTVDPGYIISLIRKLLPHQSKQDNFYDSNLHDMTSAEESTLKAGEKSAEDTSLSSWSDEITSKLEKFHTNDGRWGDSKHSGVIVVEEVWEDCGCIIWDLAANKNHAKFMVENFLLDVITMTLVVSKSARVTEICLGIMGNLACHDVLSNTIISTAGLVQTIVFHLNVNDPACLCELFRLLSVSLRGKDFIPWVEALHPDYALQRILWIAENTLNIQLLEKVLELLLVIVSQEEVANNILPSLIHLGVSDLLVSLLSSEMSKQREEHNPERIPILDLILQSIEVLSTTNQYSGQILSNKELWTRLSEIVKHPDKDEVSICCGSSMVIIANILMDDSDVALELYQDLPFFYGVLEILPFVTNDSLARGALWSILSEFLLQIQKNANSASSLEPYIYALTEKAYDMGDQLEDLFIGDHSEDLNDTKIALTRMGSILEQWKSRCISPEGSKPTVDVEKVESLLGYCSKYTSYM